MVESTSISNQVDLAAQQDQIECLVCMEKCDQGYEHWDIAEKVPKFTDLCKANKLCSECFKKWDNKCPICKVRVCSQEHYLIVKFYRMLYEKLYPIGGKYIYEKQNSWICFTSRLLNKFDDTTELFEILEQKEHTMKMAKKYIVDAISVLYMYCDIDPNYEPLQAQLTRIDTPLALAASLQMQKKGIPHLLGSQLILANMEQIYNEVQRSDEPKYIALELIIELVRRGGQIVTKRIPTQLFNMMQDVEEFKKATLKFDSTNEECIRLWSLQPTEQAE